MANTHYDCIVLGSGPGGYVAAIRAAQLGLKTAVVEKEAPGGVCLNWGCIPTKALLKSAEVYQTMAHAKDFGISVSGVEHDFAAVVDRSRGVANGMAKGVRFLMKKNKIDLIMGRGTLKKDKKLLVVAEDGAEKTYSFENIIIATGARAKTIPQLPVDGERILTYRHALALKEQPKKMLVIGAGAIGVEFAYFYSSFGTEVTIVEMLDQTLPIEDAEISKVLEKSLKKQGVDIRTGYAVDSLKRDGDKVTATVTKDGKSEDWSGTHCLVAIGVQGNVEDIGLEDVGIHAERSSIEVDEFYRTGVDGYYAIGDVIGAPWLAHVASHEGIIAAEFIAGKHPHALDYGGVPGCTYCQPQVASIGMTEKGAEESGRKFSVGRFPFKASGKAVATGEAEGMVKVIIDSEIEEVLGVHIVHPEATELIGEASIIRSHEGIASSVFNTIHAHPTLSEAIMEAMGDALGRAIHI